MYKSYLPYERIQKPLDATALRADIAKQRLSKYGLTTTNQPALLPVQKPIEGKMEQPTMPYLNLAGHQPTEWQRKYLRERALEEARLDPMADLSDADLAE